MERNEKSHQHSTIRLLERKSFLTCAFHLKLPFKSSTYDCGRQIRTLHFMLYLYQFHKHKQNGNKDIHWPRSANKLHVLLHFGYSAKL
jgi:hypothetical protein